MDLGKRIFLLNDQTKVSFEPRDSEQAKNLDDDHYATMYILQKVKNEQLGRGLKKPLQEIKRIIDGKPETIYYGPPPKTMINFTLLNTEESSGTDKNQPSTSGAFSKNTKDCSDSPESENEDEENSSNDSTDDERLKKGKLPLWSVEQENFLKEIVPMRLTEVGPKREFQYTKDMFAIIANEFNGKFRTKKTGEQLSSKWRAMKTKAGKTAARGDDSSENANSGTGKKKGKKRLTGAEKVMEMFRVSEKKRRLEMAKREESRKKEMIERENRLFKRLESLIQNNPNN